MSEAAPVPIEQVLDDEYRYLHGDRGSPPSGLTERLRRHERAGHTALCLSGGGVRSASFGLGVLEGFARAGVLGTFDYLSTVSGGGYIGGWWSAWRHRAAVRNEPKPDVQLAAATTVEPDPLARLRTLIEFLTPRTGALSPDVWTLIGTMLRNLLVNWLVLLPLVAAAAMVPLLYMGVLGLPTQTELVRHATLYWWYQRDWIPMAALIAVATTYAAFELPSLGRRSGGTGSFLALFLTPVLLVHFLLSVHRYWAWKFGEQSPLLLESLISAVAMVVPWMFGGWFGRRWWRPWTWLAAAAAGAAGRVVISSAHHALTLLAHDARNAFVVIEFPVSIALLFLQFTAFVGLASRDMDDDDREWWARAGAWLLIVAVTWLVIGGIFVMGPIALDAVVARLGVSAGAVRAVLGSLTLLSGGATYSKNPGGGTGLANQVKAVLFSAAAPIVAVLLLVLVADADRVLLGAVHDLDLFHEHNHPIGASMPEDLLVLGGLLAVGLTLGRVMSMNPFSLHAMYRARLVRTFLGVSRPEAERHPSPFTGFDADDDIGLSQLSGDGRPLHLINATLNLVTDSRLPSVECKAASFTLTAMHSGSRDVAYRPSADYAGGISLGEAMTTSGAAVSPNMGAASTPALTFLLTIFNARLGTWLGNPGAPGDATWKRRAPKFGLGALLSELAGRTTDQHPYVYLSDGGHFENLGLYEMVFRRCRFIVVSDAGGDPGYGFGDLANAVRRIRLDLGINIEFPDGIPIGPGASRPLRWAVGRIQYSAVDVEAEDGTLVYLKPTLIGDEPVDVANYARSHVTFPQQSTAEQWFDEAQFESYRMLGFHTVMSLCGSARIESVRDVCVAASQLPSIQLRSDVKAPLWSAPT
jgi:hypothetical protein